MWKVAEGFRANIFGVQSYIDLRGGLATKADRYREELERVVSDPGEVDRRHVPVVSLALPSRPLS